MVRIVPFIEVRRGKRRVIVRRVLTAETVKEIARQALALADDYSRIFGKKIKIG